MIKLYLPVYNGAKFLREAEIPSPFEVTVVDACSTDGSADAAEERNWAAVRRDRKADRVENWEYAVRHFIQSQSAWCKWLFTGDRLYPEAHDILMKAILSAPSAKLIVCEYDIIGDGKKKRWKIFSETQQISPPQTMWMTAKLGNWFGSPVGQCFNREGVVEGFSFGPWVWAADMQFCYNIAKNWPVLYVAESIGEFNMESRKTFSSQCNALSSSVEEYLVRVQAARDYLNATEDKVAYEELSGVIIQETESLIISRAFSRSASFEDVAYLFKSIPFSQLCRGIGRRLLDKLKGQ